MGNVKRYGLAISTEKANIAVSTGPCTWNGISVYASAACTITVADSTKTLLGPIVMSALEHVQVMCPVPVACTAGLSSTNSGGGYYTVFYGRI